MPSNLWCVCVCACCVLGAGRYAQLCAGAVMENGGASLMSFSLARGAAKPRATVAVAGHESARGAAVDFVTAMGDGELASAVPSAPKAALLVIPALPNTFETGKGKRPRGVRLHPCAYAQSSSVGRATH